MPIYKMEGKKDGKQKYRVRVNYKDVMGRARQIDRVACGLEGAKAMERSLNLSIKQETPSKSLTLRELFVEYEASRKKAVRESTADKSKRILEGHVLNSLGDTKLSKLNVPVLQSWKTSIDSKKLALTSKQNIYIPRSGRC